MNTLDSIFDKARDVAGDVGKKAADLVGVSRLRLQVVALGNDIDRVYQKLGLMVYEMAKAGSENRSLVHGCVAEVDALRHKLEETTARIDELKNVRRCDACGNAVCSSAQFCPTCGNLLARLDAAADGGEPLAAGGDGPAAAGPETQADGAAGPEGRPEDL